MNVSNEFLAGAVAAVSGSLEVDALGSGSMESIGFNWYRIYDPHTDDCAVVLIGEGDGHHDAVSSRESCEADDKTALTKALIKTMSFGGTDEPPGALLCVLNKGWVNAKYIDAGVLRAALTKDAAAIGCKFDFKTWANAHGLTSRSKSKKKR